MEQLRPFGPGAPAVPERPLALVVPIARQAAGALSAERWGEAQGAELQELIERERREMAEPAGARVEGPPEVTTTTTSRGPNPPPGPELTVAKGSVHAPTPVASATGWRAPPRPRPTGEGQRRRGGAK